MIRKKKYSACLHYVIKSWKIVFIGAFIVLKKRGGGTTLESKSNFYQNNLIHYWCVLAAEGEEPANREDIAEEQQDKGDSAFYGISLLMTVCMPAK